MHIIHEEIGFPRIITEKKGVNKIIYIISPLPSGFGTTLGNAFRRVLLSSIPGAAITAIKVIGVTHEYTTISDMKDSILDLALNIKRLAFRKESKESEIITLKFEGEGDVLAKEINIPTGIELLNPEHVLTTLDKETSNLEVKMKLEKGVGYLPAKEREIKDEETETDWILLDAIFSPVINVQYEVEPVRVGDMTNLDKVTIELTTNGSIEPEEAIKFAAKVLENYFAFFQKEEEPDIEPDFLADPEANKVTNTTQGDDQNTIQEAYTPVEILNLSPRTLNALINGDIGSVEELVQCTEDKLDTMRGFGKKAMTEVKEALTTRGYKLRM